MDATLLSTPRVFVACGGHLRRTWSFMWRCPISWRRPSTHVTNVVLKSRLALLEVPISIDLALNEALRSKRERGQQQESEFATSHASLKPTHPHRFVALCTASACRMTSMSPSPNARRHVVLRTATKPHLVQRSARPLMRPWQQSHTLTRTRHSPLT